MEVFFLETRDLFLQNPRSTRAFFSSIDGIHLGTKLQSLAFYDEKILFSTMPRP